MKQIQFNFEKNSVKEIEKKSNDFLKIMGRRRSIRHFSTSSIPFEVIENLVKTAAISPSGANKQPWFFAIVGDPKIKSEIRKAAENEEYINYTQRMGEQWLSDLKDLETDWQKPFLEDAPYLIVCFKQIYGLDELGNKSKHYYVNESIGISIGFLISAIHNAGLVTLTHTPSPMGFLSYILKRPKNEKAVLILPVGFPADGAKVPNIRKKALNKVMKLF